MRVFLLAVLSWGLARFAWGEQLFDACASEEDRCAGIESTAFYAEGFYPRVVEQAPTLGCDDSFTADRSYATADLGFVQSASYIARVRRSEELLPAPNAANDLFHNQLNRTEERLPKGTTPLFYAWFFGNDDAEKDLWNRFELLPSFGFYYDTGFIDNSSGKFDVPKIELGKSQSAGQTTFTGNEDLEHVPLMVLLDHQLANVDAFGGQLLQFYVEVTNHADNAKFRASQLFVRTYNGDRVTVAAGLGHSLFGVGGAVPATLSQASTLVGTAAKPTTEKPAQLRVQFNPERGGWGWGLAIEDPSVDDFTLPANSASLTRWPTIAGNVRYSGTDGATLLQFSALVRTLGFEAQSGEEFFETAWGLAALAEIGLRVEDKLVEGVYSGIAGGSGVGDYVFGIERSAVATAGSLTTIDGIGAFLGYKRQWLSDADDEFGANAAYGVTSVERVAGIPDGDNRKLQQGWANLLYFPTKNLAVGVEYQYGRRETYADGAGENHRIMAVLALTTGAAKKDSTETRSLLYDSRGGDYGGDSRASRQRF
ncbi:MAG: hypothetical protein CMJ58_11360 [Planctomycetaceae bacterium]|nr:hypothetical protein [Planctomycetaceae bacterium]